MLISDSSQPRSMMMKWIMLANSNDCKIYEYEPYNMHFALIDEISHPENKLKTHDLVTDHPGHYQSSGHRRGSFEPENDPLDIAIDDFAREIARRLNKGRIEHAFEDITFLLPARMEGLVSQHLNKDTSHCIHNIIHKNLMFMSDHEVKKYIHKLFAIQGKAH